MKFMVGNNIKSATKFFGIADDQKKTGKKILQILFYFAQQSNWKMEPASEKVFLFKTNPHGSDS